MEFQVNPGKIESVSGDLKNCAGSIESLCGSVVTVRDKKIFQGESEVKINRILNDIIKEMEAEVHAARSLGSSSEQIAQLYRKAEQNICGNTQISGKGDLKDGGDTSTEKFSLKDFWKILWKLVGSGGILGNGLAMFGSILTGGWNLKNGLGALKYLMSAIGGMATAFKAKDSAAWLKYLWGGNNALEGLADTSSAWNTFKSSMMKQFGKDLDIGKAATAADKTKVLTKWAGHLLTVAGNSVENYEEMQSGEISGGRAVAETVFESATDIALGAVATAAITALIGAAGPMAIVVGAGAALTTWGVNSVCEWLTGGDDVGEVVADFFCNIGEDIGEAVQNNDVTNISTNWMVVA